MRILEAAVTTPVQKSARRPRSAVLLTVVVVAILSTLALSARGHGYKKWLLRRLHLTHPRVVVVLPPLHPVADGTPDSAIYFEKVALPTAHGAGFTAVQVGMDRRLYAASDDGRIFRYEINADGSVGAARIFTTLQKAEGGPRLITGFCFDPHSTAANPILWVSHGYRGFEKAPDFSGRITRISGSDLETVEDVIVGLPRSYRDHLNNQPSFGPDGALYFPQGSNTASGAPDEYWGGRQEHLLSGSILRLDVSRLPSRKPLDVRTTDADGYYDPFARRASLTIYASGIRNAFALVWADDGRMYVPVNGASCGGNAPAGPGVPALHNVLQCEDDWLFRVEPGKYYGHPNPTLGHYVLNHGNPDGRGAYDEVSEYPVGTKPDPLWQPAIFNFGPHVSANGIIQYHGRQFDGRLDGKLLVCRFNVGSDIICLGLDQRGNISSVNSGIGGLSKLANPLALAEDPLNGNLYIVEYGGRRIALARPSTPRAPSHDRIGRTAPELASALSGHGNARHGEQLFKQTCIVCHGPTGGGVPNLGANLQVSGFIERSTDDQLIAFISKGRLPGEKGSVLGLTMPPKGGNPALDEAAIRDVVAFIRTLQERSRETADAQ